MEKYLVCRLDALRPNGGMRTSEYFPMVVEYDSVPGMHIAEDIVRKALDSINRGYVGLHDYIVVPLNSALVVSFRKPQPQYEVSIRNF